MTSAADCAEPTFPILPIENANTRRFPTLPTRNTCPRHRCSEQSPKACTTAACSSWRAVNMTTSTLSRLSVTSEIPITPGYVLPPVAAVLGRPCCRCAGHLRHSVTLTHLHRQTYGAAPRKGAAPLLLVQFPTQPAGTSAPTVPSSSSSGPPDAVSQIRPSTCLATSTRTASTMC